VGVTKVEGASDDGEGGGDTDEDPEEFATGIGMGDVKLLAFTGLALGYFHWYLVLVQLFVGFLIGALVAIPLLALARKGRKDLLPFAPFLAAGAIVALVWGYQIVDLYLKLLR
jgi:leader peptidase (prepilin peptidase)/N-methyltransferase